jgi:probable DNA repair protein
MVPELIEALAAGATLVTPNRRLARVLKRGYDAHQARRGRRLWPTADVLPLSAFVERAYDAALDAGAELPLRLAPAQEAALWEAIVRESGHDALLALPETAAMAREAWRLAHAWGLPPTLAGGPLSDDAQAYREWARRYETVTRRERHTDAARLPDVVAPQLARPGMRRAGTVIRYGFGFVLPQQAALFEALAAAGCAVTGAGPAPRAGACTRLECADGLDEIRRAAAWARSRLESGAARIGVVVPDLASRRSVIERAFSAVMEPDYALPGRGRRALPFNISLGEPLASRPLVSAIFTALELAGRGVDFERASRLIRSPFLAGAEAEFAQRARLDARLRERATPAVTLDGLRALLAREDAPCPLLARRLAALADFRKARLFGAQAPSAWCGAVTGALALIGFPGERDLDSVEYQTLAKWREVVAGFAALDRVLPRTGYGDAVSRLRRVAADTLFQPESPDAPVQILGELEATGMSFDCLWVIGLSDDAWPRAPRPNPLLPVELQRRVGVPQASAAGMLALARRLTGEWLSCADEVVLSHPRRDGDRAFKPSPLIAAQPAGTVALPGYASYREAVHALRDLACGGDERAPPLAAPAPAPGGTAVIRDQAACPFRAFARHRLGAEGLAAPHAGLDAAERGTLVHRVLAQAWAQLRTRAALEALPDAELGALLAQAAEAAVARARRDRPAALAGRFAEIERRRLARLAREWLQLERRRGGFAVLATEERREIDLGGLRLSARLDRVDELDDGRRVIIDYKTGPASAGALLGERPDEPQLPLYLVGAEPGAAAIAYAQVRAGDMRFIALAREADVLPEARTLPDGRLRQAAPSWQEQLEAWRAGLARLAAAYAAGDAAVDPKRYPDTCRRCDAQPFCRIYERLDATLDEDAA